VKLFELIGDNGFDLLMTIVTHADTIQFFLEENIDFAATNGPNIPNTTRVISKKETPFEALSVNQKKKFIQREQKEMEELVKLSEENYSEDQFGGENMDWLRSLGFNEEYLNEERRLGLQKNRSFQETSTENLQPAGSRVLYEGLCGVKEKEGEGETDYDLCPFSSRDFQNPRCHPGMVCEI
jgi:hypothetical protein